MRLVGLTVLGVLAIACRSRASASRRSRTATAHGLAILPSALERADDSIE
jgi:hypothetical protein